jgi:hypothetical protein
MVCLVYRATGRRSYAPRQPHRSGREDGLGEEGQTNNYFLDYLFEGS